MPRNGSGTYSLPAGNPVTTGSTISSTTHNNTMSDLASAITASVAKDGQTTPTANLPMGGFKHTTVANASARDQYSSAGQVQDGALTTLSAVSGTNTITATAPVSMSAYVSGQEFSFVAAGANTGATTININSIGAKSITRNGTTVLAAGDIPSGAVCKIKYDGTQFQLLNPATMAYANNVTGVVAIANGGTAANNQKDAKWNLLVPESHLAYYTTSTVLDASALGSFSIISSGSPTTITLPNVNAITDAQNTSHIHITNHGSAVSTVVCSSTNVLLPGSVASWNLNPGESLTFVADKGGGGGVGMWWIKNNKAPQASDADFLGAVAAANYARTDVVPKFSGAKGGAQGGQIQIDSPASGTNFAGSIIVDSNADNVRIFEAGGTYKGVYLPRSAMADGSGAALITDQNIGSQSCGYLQGHPASDFSGANSNFDYQLVYTSPANRTLVTMNLRATYGHGIYGVYAWDGAAYKQVGTYLTPYFDTINYDLTDFPVNLATINAQLNLASSLTNMDPFNHAIYLYKLRKTA